MNNKNLDKLITEALAIEAEEAREAGAIGYMARALTQATMPHRKPQKFAFERTNGIYTLTMIAPPKVGLPYGSIPRLLVSWLTTEAVRTKEREIVLGDSLSDFMRQLDLVPTGGRWGSITRLRDQTRRLFSCAISCLYSDEKGESIRNVTIADRAQLWWDPKNPNQSSLWASVVVLNQSFFEEVIGHPIPIDMRALKALKRSPMALDIYCWLTYRMSYLKQRTMIPWPALQLQFGADYERSRDFKRKFLSQMRKVSAVYGYARVEVADAGLVVKPSPPHVLPFKRSIKA